METIHLTKLVQLLKAGDSNAFDTLYREYYKGLCGFASKYVDITEAEEIVQDVMLWLWENKATLNPDFSLKALLFKMVKNRCLNEITHIKIKQTVHDKLYDKFNDSFEDPDFYIEQELIQLIDKAVTHLPTDYREAFVMNRYQELTYQEIAERSGVSAKTIAYRITQSLKKLRISLKDYLDKQ